MNKDLRAELSVITTAFLDGRLSALEAAAALAPFKDEVPPQLRDCLTDMVAIASETDHIPTGIRRDLWHPEVRGHEDEKHDRAQAWAEPTVRETCERLRLAL